MNDENDLRNSALMLYWAEGTKKGGTVDFTNSDYRMVQLWVKFLKEGCRVEESRIKLQLHLHYDMDENMIKRWWIKKLQLPLDNFTKSYIKRVKKKGTYFKKSEFGTIKVRYSSKSLLREINNQIISFSHNLLK
tara:strand:+ start:2485 stop:2886 length:402 start_codon:yes stop_codon:yes gene_type:complete